MTQMNTSEARLEIHRFVSTVMTALAFEVDEETDDATLAEFEASMDEVSSILLEALGLEVLSVDDAEERIFTVKMSLLPSAIDIAQSDE